MSDPADPLSWIEIAEEDLQAAQLALKQKKSLNYVACFHAQQCAEKYLKALLVQRGKDFPKVHDLNRIRLLCEAEGIIIPVSPQILEDLSMYAVENRYPGIPANKQDAQAALATAKFVRQFARKILGLK
ncbi:MAG: HEPN domain-containing protein [Chloroflexi bacterium]|nr:HEPN domain-containing protein [Chloroflexota bacterium]